MQIRHSLVALAAAAAVAGSVAFAADAQAQGRTIWEGFHVGGHVGWSDLDYDLSQSAPVSPLVIFNDSADGVIGGIVYGTSWQYDRWVLGTDSDYSWGDFDAGPSIAANGLAVTADVNWSSSTRVRAGYLFSPNLLIYGTVGVAYADVELKGSLIFTGKDSSGVWGVQYGGGVETTLSNRWFLRVEYLHTDYSSETFFDVTGGTVKVDLDSDVVRAAVGYRFDWSPLDLLK